MHDEAFEAARKALTGRRVNPESMRELFDAGVAAERERCAKVCDGIGVRDDFGGFAISCAKAIRKGETP